LNSSSDVFLTNRRCSTTTEWHWSGATNQGAASLKGDDAQMQIHTNEEK
jgi:hypothetical protein